MTILTTARLRLEPLAEVHAEAMNRMNSDPEVMRYLTGQPETMAQTLAVIGRVQARWADTGYSWWAVIDRASGEFAGAAALQNLRRESQLLPDPACPLEIGWRLSRAQWGRGLASEAAHAIAAHAFDTLAPDELLAVCDPDNTASAKVMQRLGMTDEGLQRWYGKPQRTYRITAEQWRSRGQPAVRRG